MDKENYPPIEENDATRFDDAIVNMIKPTMEEIYRKSANGEPLTGEDINTLLLKAQFNHVNHLDTKLNEVTTEVTSLKSDFKLLETKVDARMDVMDARIDKLESKMDGRMNTMEEKFKHLEINVAHQIQKAINGNMRWSIGIISFIVLSLSLIDKLLN